MCNRLCGMEGPLGLVTAAVVALLSAGTDGVKTPRELESVLFRNYSWKWRPAMVKSQKTIVTVGLYLRDINRVDERQHTMTIHGGLYMLWNDYRLQWDPREYGTWYLAAPPWRVWRPDWTVYNTFEPGGRSSEWQYTHNQVWLYYDGTVSYYTVLTKPITCVFDYTDFPFDTQSRDLHRCTLLIGSWMYDYSQMDMQWSKARTLTINFEWLGSTMNRTGGSGWRVKAIDAKKQFLHDDNTLVDEPAPLSYSPGRLWPLLSVRVVLQRRRPCYALLQVGPLLLACLLTLACFCVNCETVAVGVLLADLLFLGACSWTIAGQAPTGGSGSTPRIINAYGACLGLTGASLLLHLILQRLRLHPAGSRLISSLVAGTSRPWLRGLRAMHAVRISSFGTDYQEIQELTDAPRGMRDDEGEGVENAIRTIKAALCIIYALIYLICIPVTFL